MDGFPLSVGGDGSGACSSKRPQWDLNDPAPALSDAELAKESEENAAEWDRLFKEISQQAEEIARNAGIKDEERLSNIKDAVKYLADVDELDEEARIPFLTDFQKKIANPETWFKIDKECKRWGGERSLLMTRKYQLSLAGSMGRGLGNSSERAVLWVTLLHGSESTCVCDASERVRKSCRIKKVSSSFRRRH